MSRRTLDLGTNDQDIKRMRMIITEMKKTFLEELRSITWTCLFNQMRVRYINQI